MGGWPMSSAEGAVRGLLAEYPNMADASSELIRSGLNETYRVVDKKGRGFVLKVYRAGFRSIAEVRNEVEVVRHLAGEGVRVAIPIAAASGETVGTLETADGQRPYVLSPLLQGTTPELDDGFAARFGETAARIHKAGAAVPGISGLFGSTWTPWCWLRSITSSPSSETTRCGLT